MAGRSLMVAVALSAVALAVSAGCAGTQHLMASAEAAPATTPTAVEANASPAGDALMMALATEAAAAGPTPVYTTTIYSEEVGPVRSLTTTPMGPPEQPLVVNVGLARGHSYGPSSALVGIPDAAAPGDWRPMEVSLAGPAASTGLDFLVAHRTGSDQNANGSATTRGTEVRIGSGLREFKSPSSWSRPAWYVFAASDGQALIYTPSTDPTSPNHAFHMQDRVNIGDVQIGVSAEAKGMQASLSYIKREVTTMDMIRHEESKDDNFAGLTLTWRK